MNTFNRLRRFLLGCVLALVAFAAGLNPAHATHARYGSISWSVPNPATPNVVKIRFESAWRRSFFGTPAIGSTISPGGLIVVTTDPGGAAVTSLAYNPVVTAQNLTEDWIAVVQESTYTFPATTADYKLSFDLCCRISTLLDGNNDQNMRVTSRVTVRMPPLALNRPPFASTLPILTFPAGQTTTLQLAASDPDGDPVSFRVATLAESTLVVAAPAGFSISPSGLITFSPAALPATTRLHAVQLVLSDNRNAYIVLDLLLQVRPPVGLPPVIRVNGTTGPRTFTVLPGSPLSFTLSATDPENSAVALSTGTLPPGSSMSPSLPFQLVNPASTFSWTPTLANVGTYIMTFSATDADANQVSTTVTIVVSSAPPTVSCTPSAPTVTAGGTPFSISANVNDPDGSPVTVRFFIDGVEVQSYVGVAVPATRSYTASPALAIGTHTYEARVSDGLNSPASCSGTFTVVDGTPPNLALLGANPQTIEAGFPYVELGATASDASDPGVTSASIVINTGGVNTAVVGSYSVSYTVTDASNNTASLTRTVNVVDTLPPILALLGANPQTIEVGSSYLELGATASDLCDPTVNNGSVVINASAVNTAVVGSYVVTYSVTDASNHSVTLTRTVNVVDTTAPSLALNGANPQVIEVGSPYVELGATASDIGDPTVTDASIAIDASAVNTAVVGSYAVTYTVTDALNNTATLSRTVNVVDTTAPSLALNGANPQVIEVGSLYVELGATASDIGDLSIDASSIVIDSSAVNTAVVGSYTVIYTVTDASNNTATLSRTVNVVDTTAPSLALNGDNPQVIEAGVPYVELGATASDIGDLSINASSIAIDSSAVNTAVVGSYAVTYTVTDASNNTATLTRTVNVVDTTPPALVLNGANPQFIEVGSPYVELGATASDIGDPTVNAGSIVIDSSAVNTAVVGTYLVSYTVTDASNNTVTHNRTVAVQDTTAPALAILGANPQVIEVGSPYVELGANAADTGDSSINNASIVIDASAVNTAVVGSYIVTYTVSDAYNNTATLDRTVLVRDTTAPVLTLLGANPQTIAPNGSYVELGATASDVGDPAVTPASIVIDASTVNTAVPGTYLVTYTVSDASNNTAVRTRSVVVSDSVPPVITSVTPSLGQLWPPNHQMVALTIAVVATDNASTPTCSIVSVTSNEPQNGLGDGDMPNDWVITGPLSLQLRSERSGTGSGRIYTITVKCTDGAGNSTTATTTVTVPKSQAKK